MSSSIYHSTKSVEQSHMSDWEASHLQSTRLGMSVDGSLVCGVWCVAALPLIRTMKHSGATRAFFALPDLDDEPCSG